MPLVFLLLAVVGDGDFWFVIQYITREWVLIKAKKKGAITTQRGKGQVE